MAKQVAKNGGRTTFIFADRTVTQKQGILFFMRTRSLPLHNSASVAYRVSVTELVPPPTPPPPLQLSSSNLSRAFSRSVAGIVWRETDFRLCSIGGGRREGRKGCQPQNSVLCVLLNELFCLLIFLFWEFFTAVVLLHFLAIYEAIIKLIR